MMKELEKFDRDYLRVVLRLDRHIAGYVDAYFGPADLKEEIEDEGVRPPAALLDDVKALQEQIPGGDPDRARYLRALLRALEGTVRILSGERFDYLEEVAWLYDIRPERVDEARFEQAHDVLDSLLPGDGPLAARMQAWREHYELDANAVLPLLEQARAETRQRTQAFVDLVPGEGLQIELVEEEPWIAYNWYLGDGQSLIQFNTDFPISALTILSIFAHEGYPGHHTEAQLKERWLYQEKGYGEQAVALLHSPAAVIAEGIATKAVEIIFPNGGQHEWTEEVLLRAAGLPTRESAAERQHIAEAMRDLRHVSPNAAILHHSGELGREETLDYLIRYGLNERDRAEKRLEFITNPLFRSYIFTYTEGYELVSKASGSDPVPLFRRLLTEQVLPSSLAAINAEDGPR